MLRLKEAGGPELAATIVMSSERGALMFVGNEKRVRFLPWERIEWIGDLDPRDHPVSRAIRAFRHEARVMREYIARGVETFVVRP